MAKAKIIILYLFCFLICFGAASQDAVSKREQVKSIYDSQIGVRETGGANRGRHVERYLSSVGFDPGYAWCAAFVSWCYQQAEINHPKSAWVPSYARKQNIIYKRGEFLKSLPQQGDVFLIWFSNLNRPAHIGFVDRWKEKWVITVEGNTNDDGSREGDGVYRKRRLQRQVWAVSNFIDAQ